MILSAVEIHKSWKDVLNAEFEKDYFQSLVKFLKEREGQSAVIYPPESDIFNAYNLTPIDNVKVVVLGQDPYHGAGEAHGLCFSVQDGVRIPPSLRNIFKELQSDLVLPIPTNGNLTKWAQNGVFLLNTILTVEHKSPASHKNKGWESFTDATIKAISNHKRGVVFILWGKLAQSKKVLIDTTKHLILEAPHPAAEVYAGGKAGFFGSKPFSKANLYLAVNAVDWSLV
jgi:uracil-DNA glycosylase